MPIGNTRIHRMLKNGLKLSHVDAWRLFFQSGENSQFVIDLVTKEQLLKERVAGDGEHIGYYSFGTEIASGGEKKEGEPFNLYDTGEWQSTITLFYFDNSFVISSDPIKDEDNLYEKYGVKIVELTKESKAKIRQRMFNFYLSYVRKTFFRT